MADHKTAFDVLNRRFDAGFKLYDTVVQPP